MLSEKEGARGGEYIWAAVLIAANCTWQILALGADTPLFGALAALTNIVVALGLVLLSRPDPRTLRMLSAPVVVLLAGLAWAVWPDIAGSSGQSRIAPDLVAPDAARVVGFIALLAGTAAVGARRDWTWSAAEWITAGGLVCLVVGLALRAVAPHAVWGLPKGILADRYTGTMLNANTMGACHAAFALVALGMFLAQLRGGVVGNGRYRVVRLRIYGAAALMHFGACEITGSRTAFAALVLAAVFMTILYRSHLPAGKRGRYRWVAALTIGAVGLFAADIAVADRFASLVNDWDMRTALWGHYGALAASAGPHGHGLGSFAQINAANLPDTMLATDLWYVNAAHNVVLQCVLEGGAVYAALVALAVTIMAVFIALRLPHGHPARLLQLSVISASIVMLIVGLDDIAFNVPAAATLAITMWGLAFGRANQRRLALGQNPKN